MIPDLQASLVCEDVRVEASGAHTIVGVINGIATPSTPVRLMKLCVWTRWCTGYGRYTQITRFLKPDEETVLAKASTEFGLENEESHVINVNIFSGIEFSELGMYHVEILLDENMKLRYPLRVFTPQSLQ